MTRAPPISTSTATHCPATTRFRSAAADERAQLRFLEFFAVTIRNPHTRRAYARAAGDFLAWCEARGVLLTSFGIPSVISQSVNIVPLNRSEEHTSELQSLMRISYAVFCFKTKNYYSCSNIIH